MKIELLRRISLRTQIFISMILLVLLTCLLILVATFFQYQNESIDYNIFRLNRKESQLRKFLDVQEMTDKKHPGAIEVCGLRDKEMKKANFLFKIYNPDQILINTQR